MSNVQSLETQIFIIRNIRMTCQKRFDFQILKGGELAQLVLF